MEINTARLFLPWAQDETGRLVVSELESERSVASLTEKMQKLLRKKQFETGQFYGLKIVNVYKQELALFEKDQERCAREGEEGSRIRAENLKKVDLLVFRITFISGIIFFGCAYRFGEGKHQRMGMFVAVLIPTIAYPILARVGYGFYPEVLPKERVSKPTREQSPFDLVLYRYQLQRTLPANFDIDQDVEIFTQELFTKEQLGSPSVIYLPNCVVDSISFVRSVLEKGEMRHTVENRDFTEEELQKIMKQISSIFLISPWKLSNCLEEKVSIKGQSGLDQEGQYTSDAKDAIRYSFNGIKDSALPEIDQFFDRIEKRWTFVLVFLGQKPLFQQFFSQISELHSIQMAEVFKVMEEEGIPCSSFLELQMNEGENILVPVFLYHLIGKILLKLYGPDWFKRQGPGEVQEEKERLKRKVRSEILGMTSFHLNARKIARKEARVASFEELTGISLSGNEDG